MTRVTPFFEGLSHRHYLNGCHSPKQGIQSSLWQPTAHGPDLTYQAIRSQSWDFSVGDICKTFAVDHHGWGSSGDTSGQVGKGSPPSKLALLKWPTAPFWLQMPSSSKVTLWLVPTIQYVYEQALKKESCFHSLGQHHYANQKNYT